MVLGALRILAISYLHLHHQRGCPDWRSISSVAASIDDPTKEAAGRSKFWPIKFV